MKTLYEPLCQHHCLCCQALFSPKFCFCKTTYALSVSLESSSCPLTKTLKHIITACEMRCSILAAVEAGGCDGDDDEDDDVSEAFLLPLKDLGPKAAGVLY